MILEFGAKGPVIQHFTSESRTKRSDNLVDVVVSGKGWSILARSCFIQGMTVGNCCTVEAMHKQC
jgi:hypothetical protein